VRHEDMACKLLRYDGIACIVVFDTFCKLFHLTFYHLFSLFLLSGGESNPCTLPIFDEYVEAPARVGVTSNGEIQVQQAIDLHTSKIVNQSATIGNLPPKHTPKPSMDGLFIPLSRAESVASTASSSGSNENQTGIAVGKRCKPGKVETFDSGALEGMELPLEKNKAGMEHPLKETNHPLKA
jgi:hypothetical protein